ncbi:MAG: type II toxin-antitoxin system antitoxin, RelB/DinJ family, partial [Lachnospiraceae bacterium]|nr:type II toxin-antitoxin system antitoxin, RelB/DinJ family [Lachnospiraceae bacterium]
MAQTNVNIRMDEDLKREFDSTCQDLGLTMTTAFN